jgi:hypothetical protein
MSSRQLNCVACRIWVRGTAAEVDLLEGMCPICGARLGSAGCASDVRGFRCLDLGARSEQESSEAPNAVGRPVDLVARREAAAARDDLDVERWLDGGGSFSSQAVAK